MNEKDGSSTRDSRSWNQWVTIAEQDWTVVESLVSAKERVWAAIAFHAQQAVEKYLKAFLAFNGVKPRKTHDLSELLNEATRHDPTLIFLADDCAELSVYAIDARYPEVPDNYNERVGTAAIAAGRRVCATIIQRLEATKDEA